MRRMIRGALYGAIVYLATAVPATIITGAHSDTWESLLWVWAVICGYGGFEVALSKQPEGESQA